MLYTIIKVPKCQQLFSHPGQIQVAGSGIMDGFVFIECQYVWQKMCAVCFGLKKISILANHGLFKSRTAMLENLLFITWMNKYERFGH